MKKFILLFFFAYAVLPVCADDLHGSDLLDSIHKLIQPVKVLKYGGGDNRTWAGFNRTDKIDGNIVRDRYSNNIYTFQLGNESVPGMNIEHIWANSWWGHEQNNAYKDLFNLYPGDEVANQRKSNNPIGVVDGKVRYENGVVKIGESSSYRTDSIITAWEPADQWKGDFARTYFYMATCYSHFGKEGLWQTPEGLLTVDPASKLVMRPWVYNLMLKWAKEDPVDQIEMDRCDSIEYIQGNRNPFVDFPGLCEYIWGDSVDCSFDLQRIIDRKNPSIVIEPDPDPSVAVVVSVSPKRLVFTTIPEQPSMTQNVTVYMKNVETPSLTATVEYPFQLSLDGQSWSQKITTTFATQGFYIRFAGSKDAGFYESEVLCSVPDAEDKIIPVSCDVDQKYCFFENFEVGTKGSYAEADVHCNAATWNMKDAMMAADNTRNDGKSVRIKGAGTLTMKTEKEGGCSILSFYAGLYNKDTGMKLTVDYSLDGGRTWQSVIKELTVGSWQRYEYPLNINGNVMLRFTCVGPTTKRISIDDIQMTDYTAETNVVVVPDTKHADASVTFDLAGRRVKDQTKGIIIRRGKKILER